MEKIKQFIENEKGKDILVIIIIILVGLGSFELGRLSKNQVQEGIKIEYIDQEANIVGSMYPNLDNQIPNSLNSNIIKSSTLGNFFGSTRGSKYYSLSCSSGKTIKQENRIYFLTPMEAEAAGYELSSSCK
ncbi:MAG: hypothetical protein UR25_C0002G0092 [Candidatus Nomurabacteria bacterium GW2011_GWE1_32_28]|uniref:Ada DNA repair metal-binding domain-containing protein n=1 Tax=Candidatus Nomurabacteria bacterium GW2011_GWF1_31_48 TaxID=1618767 RepID=A0A0F9YVT3_9BACT|nr:MAG: hypothetical protein UR10_C0002G0092 [Candidatus Nomurabacteria bacterium GW2011_GWF2_30_133]KKP29019.1 MAG: hypothetical protein UR18_C0001G0140 [Candidatus Nomurabacteria bacterium GW2011_GWE2_31_40]KKP30571.1 MAG: hypothetical protein UR19_C0002G0092 [Candidatus Nomurabacteria bacterium GW2011_GWF1_31_48]KKP35056.1 MAG: hypothetical protein UR25_C0002G0092 [Candidatus Nomurabacteria bacterium GW2011_GWE1_32_28]HAS80580.1 hypothetical protein [Candidatus Nomurabacteria bacterium]